MRILPRRRQRTVPLAETDALKLAIAVARGEHAPNPKTLDQLPDLHRKQVEPLLKAVTQGSAQARSTGGWNTMRPVRSQRIAAEAAMRLEPSSTLTPDDIDIALRAQGLDFVEPFAPGRPLTPYYGYDRRPRGYDYEIGRNVTTETRPDRIPFGTLKHLTESYDVAGICTRYAINDVRSMNLQFEAVEGWEDDITKEVRAARAFLRRPDGKRPFRTWIAQHAMDVWRYDAGTLYKERDKAGRVIALKVIDCTTIAPMLDYFGEIAAPPAPGFQQFIQGVPWDWLTSDDLIYQPMWPLPESPYGVAPIEVVLINANTDLRLQQYFLQFFTTGQVPEAFAIAPEDQSDPDSLAEWQETYNAWTYGDQRERWGLRWLPNGTSIVNYKPQEFDPKLAEYVMRRTIAAYQMVPQNLGILDDVNRATSDTQMDQQTRVGSLPNKAYYEDLIDPVLQDDLSLPIRVRFDDGREKEDRLMEAQAHQIYVSMGAESPDEVREHVLGLDVANDEKIPRFFDSKQLGPVPISYLIAISGETDPATGAPVPGTVQPLQFVLPGAMQPAPAGTGPVGNVPQTPNPDPAAGWSIQSHQQQSDHSHAGYGQPGHPITQTPATGANAPTAPSPGGAPSNTQREDRRAPAPMRTKRTDPAKPAGKPGAKKPASAKKAVIDDLAKWRANSRKRVALGQTPRQFTSTVIPPDVAARVWSHLEHATSRDTVDAAFTKAVTDEPGGEPSPKGWGPADFRPGPGRDAEEALVEYWEQRILATLNRHVDPQRIAADWLATNPAEHRPNWAPKVTGPDRDVDPLRLLARSYAVRIETEPDAVTDTLTDLYADAYQAGLKEGADQIGHLHMTDLARAVVGAVDWDRWTPGHIPAADRLHGLGMERMLQDARVTIQGVDQTTRARIATQLEAGVRAGEDGDTIAARIAPLLNNPERARMIAITEVNRAMTRANLDMYTDQHIPMWRLVTAPGACPECEAIKAANPHPVTDIAESPPVHPWCRCAAAPAV